MTHGIQNLSHHAVQLMCMKKFSLSLSTRGSRNLNTQSLVMDMSESEGISKIIQNHPCIMHINKRDNRLEVPKVTWEAINSSGPLD